jgi:hypothetical protein
MTFLRGKPQAEPMVREQWLGSIYGCLVREEGEKELEIKKEEDFIRRFESILLCFLAEANARGRSE